MSNFNYCIDSLLKKEGGFQAYANDKGNYFPYGNLSGTLLGTNYGITPVTFKNYFGYVPTREDMETISKPEAEQLYYNLFWLPYGFNQIQNKYLANVIFDTFVLFSYFSFSQIVPMINNSIDYNTINSANANVLINDIIARRIDMHNYNVNAGYVSGDYLKGWINRANSFKVENQKLNSYIPFIAIGFGGLLVWYYTKDKKKKY